ncbi:MAG: relaxase/mobilization nuclease domain-containing protein [Faecousia sp.]
MAIFKMVSGSGKYQDDLAIPNLIAYITDGNKAKGDIIGGCNVDFNNIAGSMIQVSEHFKKNSHIRAHHFIVSFLPHEVHSVGVLMCIANQICQYFSEEYQIVYALHEDTGYPHLHFVFNAVSYVDGHRYRGGIGEYKNLYYYIKRVLKEYYIYNYRDIKFNPATDHPNE